MTTQIKFLWVALVAVAILAFGAYQFPQQAAEFGRTGTEFVHGITVDSVSTFTGVTTFTSTLVNTSTTVLNNLIQGGNGFSLTIAAATVITATQFCSVSSIVIPPTAVAAFTITLPSATSTRLTCGATLGSFADQLIDNESSIVVTIATTTGEILGQGVQMQFASTTGPVANATLGGLTATGVAIPATTTLQQRGIYTGTSTTNVKLNILNSFFTRQ